MKTIEKMKEKKIYITPLMTVHLLPTCHLLAGSPEEVLDMPWSGNQPGTAGPGGIDPYSTIEVF